MSHREQRVKSAVITVFDGSILDRLDGSGRAEVDRDLLEAVAAQIRWNQILLADRFATFQVALPEAFKRHMDWLASRVGSVQWLWANDKGHYEGPDAGGCVWIIDGMHTRAVDWDAVRSRARESLAEIIALREQPDLTRSRYLETVRVNEDGTVHSFARHYTDSVGHPAGDFTKTWLAITPPAVAGEVVERIMREGWGGIRPATLTNHEVEWIGEEEVRLGSCHESVDEMLARRAKGPEIRSKGNTTGYRFAKRTLDIVASGGTLIALFPLLVLVAVLVKMTSKGPVLFGHRRQGLMGREFKCLKFRTMIVDAEELQEKLRAQNEVDGPQFKITNDPRLTPIGAFLRKFNIDELPQFYNVLVGQMSLVGPRPSPDGENQFCPGWRRTRLAMRPGITGLWQVMRLRREGNSDFQEWIYYDLEYARHRSFWLDWRILWHTPTAMFASSKLNSFAADLARRGICTQSARLILAQNPVAPPPAGLQKAG